MKRTIRSAALTVGALIASLGLPVGTAHADTATPRIDLQVLVVSDGGPATDAIAAELDTAGTPYTEIDLQQSGRSVIDSDFLADTVDGTPRAKCQAVVLPNDNPFSADSAEMAALAAYEQTYAIPQVDAYTYARPEAGLEYPVNGGYSDSVDGVQAQVTAAGKAGPFDYLNGSVPFEDNSPDVGESIATNHAWGQAAGLPLENGELVTGEHSGLKVPPQQPEDNPDLALALADNDITWLGSDNSRDPEQRQAGPVTTVSRYPMNVFYNAGRAAEQVDEYNWIYTSRAQGGSGICEENPATSTCLPAPLDTTTGYADYIVPLETRTGLGHVLSNDPKPHFIHQSNLAEDRIAYPVLDGVLDTYSGLFAENTPMVNLRMKDTGAEMQRRTAWKATVAAGQVTAYRAGAAVTVQAPDGISMTATMPTGTTNGSAEFGDAYAGEVSGWTTSSGTPLTLTLPASAPSPAATVDATEKASRPRPAPRTPVPTGVTEQVPYTSDN